MNKLLKKFTADDHFIMADHLTDVRPDITEEEAIEGLKKVRKQIAKIQDIIYAHNKYAVLICFQGMDTAGKDSLIREVFQKFNARGVVVHSFKTPTSKELQHDYLWRHVIALPEKGKFGVFNRTHYENVLVTRVHPEYILNENIPSIDTVEDIPKDFWKTRYDQINAFEQHVVKNGIIVFKFFLHLSKDEQKNRLLRRLEQEKHNWKFSPGDLKERELWDQYMTCYEEAIQHTSKKHAPWYIIPSDNKAISRYLVAKIILEKLKKYKDIQYPEMPPEIEQHKAAYKRELEDNG
ncbi:PPK2 family polyphosphate kinase [Sphingobacterium chuzhouense]|uniref:Polyphosphate kinase 2 family protein n=1 Tax=Sphingobacterium chuzhouense TaxID=1742264 RepID=A0ABR7XS30_9SPHI|nr:PPK2 family polyphosphate kinase [Sphingobacterium chuzhouense]MBD1421971.1 polyphosphate kinase 2 family protein [Sphingobacterium chuzhouense]